MAGSRVVYNYYLLVSKYPFIFYLFSFFVSQLFIVPLYNSRCVSTLLCVIDTNYVAIIYLVS